MRTKVLTTVELVDLLKSLKGFTSDYQAWKFLGWKQATMSSYRVGRSHFSRPHALRVADELGLPREYVLACVELERESDDTVRGVWQSIAAKFRGRAASILLAVAGAIAAGSPAPSEAYAGHRAETGQSLYIMSTHGRNRRRRERRGRHLPRGLLPAAA